LITRLHWARATSAGVLAAAVLVGCATLPPARPATDIGAIAGKWEGTLTARNGARFAYTTTISKDGKSETIIPGMSNPGPRFVGTVALDGSKYRWKSETTGRTGTYILHEGAGRRVLVSHADDGGSYGEAMPGK
jgi:hypothetical protein